MMRITTTGESESGVVNLNLIARGRLFARREVGAIMGAMNIYGNPRTVIFTRHNGHGDVTRTIARCFTVYFVGYAELNYPSARTCNT